MHELLFVLYVCNSVYSVYLQALTLFMLTKLNSVALEPFTCTLLNYFPFCLLLNVRLSILLLLSLSRFTDTFLSRSITHTFTFSLLIFSLFNFKKRHYFVRLHDFRIGKGSLFICVCVCGSQS